MSVEVASFESYRALTNQQFPIPVGITNPHAYSGITRDPETIWTVAENGLSLPAIYPARYDSRLSRPYLGNDVMRYMGVCPDPSLIGEVALSADARDSFDTLFVVTSELRGEAPASELEEQVSPQRIDTLKQVADGEQSAVHFLRVVLAAPDEAKIAPDPDHIKPDEFADFYTRVYLPQFKKLSNEFPVSGHHSHKELAALHDAEGAKVSLVRSAGGDIAACIFMLPLQTDASYNLPFIEAQFGSSDAMYCPVAVSTGESAMAAVTMMKKMGTLLLQGAQSGEERVFYYDCPNRSFEYDQKLVAAMLPRSRVQQEVYARQLYEVWRL